MNKKIIWGILGIVVIIIALVSMNVLQKNAKEATFKVASSICLLSRSLFHSLK